MAQRYQIRSARILFNVEVLEDDKVAGAREVPVQIFEAQFDSVSLASLASQLLAQANRLPEDEAEGKDQGE